MKSLFDQTQIGNMKLKNRLIRAATGDRYARKGHMTEKDFALYENLARGGVSTIITGQQVCDKYLDRLLRQSLKFD